MRLPYLKTTLLFFSALLFSQTTGATETVQQLLDNYSGKATWDEVTRTLSFDSTGTVYFAWKEGDGTDIKKDQKQNFWEVPTSVERIVIAENCTVTCAFHTYDDIIIEGEDRYTSVVYGTDMASWHDKVNEPQVLEEWQYCQFQHFGGVLTLRKLTSLNPFAFHVRGWGTLCHVSNCDFIDSREGHYNHSDGFTGGHGSTVDSCYYSTGDDIFKTHFDNTITNCTINMRQNTVPIQLGWHALGDGSVVNFKNLTITGNSGRGADGNAIVVSSPYDPTDKYSITVNIDGLNLHNPNASWVSLKGEDVKVSGTVTNSTIDIARFWTNNNVEERTAGTCEMYICGELTGKNTTKHIFDCVSESAPASPTGLLVSSALSTVIDLTWSNDAIADAQSIEIQQSSDGVSGWETVENMLFGTPTFTVAGLIPSTTYYYRIRAINVAGESDWSEVSSGTTVDGPAVPDDGILNDGSFEQGSVLDNSGGSWGLHGEYVNQSTEKFRSGVYSAKFYKSPSSNYVEPEYDIAPLFDCYGSGDYLIDFYVYVPDFNDGKVEFYYVIDGEDVYPQPYQAILPDGTNRDQWVKMSSTQSHVKGKPFLLKSKTYYGPGGASYYVDDMSITTVNTNTCATSLLQSVNSIIKDFKVFPNPVQGNSTVSYHLSENANVNLALYDLAGRCVKTIISREQIAGDYDFQLDAKLTSGLYLLELKSVSASKTDRTHLRVSVLS